MENIDFDWLNDNFALNYGIPEFSASSSPRADTVAEQASPVALRARPAAERVDQPSGEHALPLLRLSSWKSDGQL